MRRPVVLISVVLLAVAGYFAWRLIVGREPPPVPLPTDRPSPAAPPTETSAETRDTTPLLPSESRPETPPSAADRIEGTVYDESGRPVPDVEVQIIQREYLAASTRPIDRRFAEKLIESTATNAAGQYAFSKLVPEELKIVRASKPGYVPVFTEGVRVPKTHDFHLVTGSPVSGSVVNAATQQPIEGVGVKGWHASPGGPEYRWMEEVFTNSAGQYSFEAVPSGTVTFMLAHPEYVDQHIDRQVVGGVRNQFRFEIRRGMVIEGVVLYAKDGAPAADVVVHAKDNVAFPRWTARTDRAGRFRMIGVKTGKILFELSGRYVNPLRELRELTEAEDFFGNKQGRRLEFRAYATGRAHGRVVNRSGDPVPSANIFVAPATGAFILVRDPTEYGGSLRHGETRTGTDGTFLVDGLTITPNRIVAEAPGLAIGASDPFVVNPDEIFENVVVTLNPAPAVQGTISDEIGAPVANAVVTADIPPFPGATFVPGFEMGQSAQRTVVTNESGRYRFELPYGCKLTIRVDHADYVLAESEVTVEELKPDAVLDFKLNRALSISGTVTMDSGQLEPDVVVRAWRESEPAPIEAKVAASGEYRVTRLLSGFYRVGAIKPGSNLASEFRDEVPAGSTGIDFKLVKLGEIVGVVTNAGGSPVTKFFVYAAPKGQRTSDPEARKPSTAGLKPRELNVEDPGGVFRIGRVEPAVWTLHVVSSDHAPAMPVEVRVLGGDAPTSAGTFVLQDGGILRGRVLTSSGAGIEGVDVKVSRARNLPNQDPTMVPLAAAKPKTARSGVLGDFEVRGLFPGDYLVKLEAQRFVQPIQDTVRILEGVPVEQSFRMKLSASLDLVVKDEGGQPVAGAIIDVLDDQRRRLPSQIEGGGVAVTDASGKYRFRALPAGEALTIKVVRRGFLVEERPQTLREGDNGTLEVRLEQLR